jgi:hypothetical protein
MYLIIEALACFTCMGLFEYLFKETPALGSVVLYIGAIIFTLCGLVLCKMGGHMSEWWSDRKYVHIQSRDNKDWQQRVAEHKTPIAAVKIPLSEIESDPSDKDVVNPV